MHTPSSRQDLSSTLYEKFKGTKEGQNLQSAVRYERYKPVSMGNSAWEKLLGADVNNLHHLPLTRNLTRTYLDHYAAQEYSEAERELLLATAITHDWAEAITGDISYDEKQDHHEEEEHTILEMLLRESLGEETSLPQEITETIKNRTTKLGQTFNMIERFGYLRTALRAWEERAKLLQQEKSEEELLDNLAWLTSNVFINNIPAILSLSSTYTGISTYLNNKGNLITEAFNSMPRSIFTHTSKPEEEEIKWERAKYLWEKHQEAQK
jgi:hypothetical protein